MTATVIDAVPPHETGVAYAVVSVANLSAIAILGTVALSILDHALTPNLQNPALSEGAKHTIQAARGQVALTDLQGADRANAELLLKASLAESLRWVMRRCCRLCSECDFRRPFCKIEPIVAWLEINQLLLDWAR